MKILDDFEVVNVADEHIVVPVGSKAEYFKGVVVVSEAAAFLLEYMKTDISREKLVSILTEHFDVDREKAISDVTDLLSSLKKMGLVSE